MTDEEKQSAIRIVPGRMMWPEAWWQAYLASITGSANLYSGQRHQEDIDTKARLVADLAVQAVFDCVPHLLVPNQERPGPIDWTVEP